MPKYRASYYGVSNKRHRTWWDVDNSGSVVSMSGVVKFGVYYDEPGGTAHIGEIKLYIYSKHDGKKLQFYVCDNDLGLNYYIDGSSSAVYYDEEGRKSMDLIMTCKKEGEYSVGETPEEL
jgi:hypothetical protein